MIDYRGKTALVTGGASGIGAALARALTARGARVVVADVNGDGAHQVAGDLGGEAVAVTTDLSDPKVQGGLIAGVAGRVGRIDLVCSNAGRGRRARVLEEPLDASAYAAIELNMLAAVRLAQAYAAHIAEAGGQGRMLFTCSENSLSQPSAVQRFRLGLYGATKHGLLILLEWMRGESAAKGVPLTFHALLPGGVFTPAVAGDLKDISEAPPEFFMITPDRCAELALKGMDLELFYIPTHAHIAEDMRPRMEGVRASLAALGL